MYIDKIKLTNFRSHKDADLTFDPSINLITGRNGSGKTNLLEAIYYLTIGKSHRKSPDKDLVMFDETYFRLDGYIATKEGRIRIETGFSPEQGRKMVKLNKTRLDRISELLQKVSCVQLSPDDIELTRGSPLIRRHFMDMALVLTAPSYLHALQEYRRVLSQRNELLRGVSVPDPTLLGVWDDQLVEWGARLILKRFEFINRLVDLVNKLYHSLSSNPVHISLSYTPFGLSEAVSLERIQTLFREKLANNRARELKQGYTLTGPHRDNLRIAFGGLSLKRFGSQGQHRLVSTALRLSQALYLKEENEDCPVVLFDDVFAELDSQHKELLFQMTLRFDQVFIVSPQEPKIFPRQAKKFHLQDGDFLQK
ncbi:MAG: DNA replication/repair protein RecF [Candidatus Cloacimonetes bacterium 4572_55]|nr:MAG: DNA replication/repair protein RecF [Candidatus Cloacimonetes bacterium 4572_55]